MYPQSSNVSTKSSSVRRFLAWIWPVDQQEATRPRKIIVLMNLIGVGAMTQTMIPSLFLVMNWVATTVHLLSLLMTGHGITFTFNRMITYLMMMAIQTYLIASRKSIAIIIAATTQHLSTVNFRRLSRLEQILCRLAWSSIIFTLLARIYIVLNVESHDRFKPYVYLGKFSRAAVLSVKMLAVLHLHTHHVAASLYAWVFYALYLRRCEEGEGLIMEIVRGKRPRLTSMIATEKVVEWFESNFSLLLFLVISSNYLATLSYLYSIIESSSKWTAEIMASLAAFMATHIAVVVVLVGFITHCQDNLRRVSGDICNALCESGPARSDPSNFLLMKKLEAVYHEPVTVWQMMNVSRQLVLAMAASLLPLSVLIMQIDNGSLKSP